MTLQDEIKQKAEECKNKVYEDVYQESDLAEQKLLCINDFTAGANFILDKLRWRDPKDELPKDGECVLVKTIYCDLSVAYYWEEKGDFVCWDTPILDVVGWREIIEP